MGAYIVQVDIEYEFGSANVRKWSQLDPTKTNTTDMARVAWAIAKAEGWAEGRLRGTRYAVPFVNLDIIVKGWIAVQAGLLLRSPGDALDSPVGDEFSTDRYGQKRNNVLQELKAVLGGQLRLNMGTNGSHPTCPVVC